MSSKLDLQQIFQELYDETNGGLSIIPAGGTLVPGSYDWIGASYPSATEEVYTYKTGGAGGTVVSTVTVTYSDASKATLVSVAKT